MTNPVLRISAVFACLLAGCATGLTKPPPPGASYSWQSDTPDYSPPPSWLSNTPDYRHDPSFNGSLDGPVSVYTSPNALAVGELPVPMAGRAPTSPLWPGSANSPTTSPFWQRSPWSPPPH